MAHKVLLIDDSHFVQSLVRAELGIDGYDIFAADNGKDGILKAREVLPDVILLDVTMPGMSGYEVCEYLTSLPETANIPIIFLSGATEATDRVHGLKQGAVDYITKPFVGDELRARVQISLKHKIMLEIESKRAMQDGLTGLWNRAYFDQRLVAELALAQRHGLPFSCIMFDIDHFKAVNDVHGHGIGDRAIQLVAMAIQQSCRREDIACRYGGEEFVVICTASAAPAAVILAERVRLAVSLIDLQAPKGRVPLTCSAGVADAPKTPELVNAADQALYRAKKDGRNCVRIAESPAVPPVTNVAKAA